jgi:tripartite-type tricarboxylate transporter receptor subunit TctC
MVACPAQPALADTSGRPLTVVVPFPAGGTADIAARILGERLSTVLGRSVVVENKGGAATAIGAQAVAAAEKDGNTLLFAAATTFTTNPHLMPGLKYRLEDFAPVAMVTKVPFAFVVKKDFPAKSVAEYRAYALANPGKVNNGTNGAGSTVHLLGELVARDLGVKLQQVHYRGAAPAMNDMLAGVIDSNVEALANSAPNHKAGLYRALAVLSDQRLPQLPEVPTFGELGYPGIVGGSWFALFAPAGTPPAVVAKLSGAVSDIVRSPDFAKRMADIGNEAVAMSPAELDAFVRKDSDRLGALIREVGIKLEP